jgi:ligand-binding SRPBCC domain-containing protein
MHTLKTVQRLPLSLQEAWDFFSSPKNLATITPSEMGFIIRSEVPEKMHSGLFIHYTVKPLMGIPMKWVTEITHVNEPHFFVDEQRQGPYTVWHHQHHFRAIEGGVEMTDIIDYRVPMGVLGNMANALIVRRKVKGIFEYRRKKLVELFGEM